MRVTTLVKHMLPRRVRPFARRLRVGVLKALYPGVIIDEYGRPSSGVTGLHLPAVEIAEVWGGAVPPPLSNGGPRGLREAYRPATFFPVDESPGELAGGRGAWRAAWRSLGDERCDAIIRLADEAVARRFDLLGSRPTELPGIDWHVDFKSGARWKLLPIAKVPTVLPHGGSDIKVVWELSRFYHAPVLGVAFLLTGDTTYAEQFVVQVESWIRNNPVGHGPNWLCAMEAAIRVGNWLAALPFVMPDPHVTDEFLEMFLVNVFEHGRHIRGHLEGTPTLRSNHYLADLQGLIYVGLQFPDSAEAREWVEFGVSELEHEMAWEVYPDGTDFEASTAYHRLCLELFLGPAVLCGSRGVTLSSAFWSRLEKMFTAVAALADCNGRVPLLGDNDSGRLHRMIERDDDDLSYLLPIGAALFENPALRLPDVPFSEEAMLYLGPAGRATYDAMPEGVWPEESSALPDSGWYTLRRDGECMHVTCGPNGQPFKNPPPGEPKWNGGHAHNDKLSICYAVNGTPVLVDPGQYCYTSDFALRNHSRSTASHNVAQVNGLEQQLLRSDYLFNIHDDRARPTVERWTPGAADGPWFVGAHHGYEAGAGVVYRRSIAPLRGRGFAVTDALAPAGPDPGRDLELTFHFHAAAGLAITEVSPRWWRFGDLAELTVVSEVDPTAQVDDDFVAPAYGLRHAARVLRLSVRVAAPAEIMWTLVPIASARESSGARAVAPASPPEPRVEGPLLAVTKSAIAGIPARPAPSPGPPSEDRRDRDPGPALYTRLDYWNVRAVSGGSFGHTAHVVRAFQESGQPVHVASGFHFPMLDPTEVPTTILRGPALATYRDDTERQYFEANRCMRERYAELVVHLAPSFIYERPVIGSFIAAETAHRLGIPYVVEYNGSEIWIRRHWTRDPFRYEKLMDEVESTVLAAADLVVVVSSPLRAELIERGLSPERILVNPNAVDPREFDRTRHAEKAIAMRRQHGFHEDHIVIGFIGTFGYWHGVPTLAAALPGIVATDPRVRVLLIGDGSLRAEIQRAVEHAGIADRVVLTGIVPQKRAPEYLAMCDMYLSPHQTPPNDERPFFGSPTKLLEYMAMERPMIASAMGQIIETVDPALRVGDLAEADATQTAAVGILVEPGDHVELIEAVRGLVARPDLGRRLATNARMRVEVRHTWRDHVGRILERLHELSGVRLPVYTRPLKDGERT